MTTGNDQAEIESLRHTIDVLEAENAQLSERAEEAMLLGLVAETLQSLADPVEIFESVLERISILKDIPFIVCGRLVERQLQPAAAYASFSNQTGVGLPIHFNVALLDEISQGPYVTKDLNELSADFAGESFHPAFAAIIPFTSHLFPDGLFLFMDGDRAADRLTPMLFMLDRIVDMTVSRIDNQYLMQELSLLNKELEARVEDRTRALVVANVQLKSEIAERKQSERALKKAHERFVTVLDGIDAHVYAADLHSYEILFMNRKMKEDFGIARVGEKCYQVFRNEMSPCKTCTNSRLLDAHGRPGRAVTSESKSPITGNWYMNHDRAVSWVDERVAKLQIAIDITDLKRAEQEKRQLQARFEQSQKLEAIGTLAGGIAHDFNNLLMGIQGRTSLMMLDLTSSDAHHEHLKSIESYVRSATGLTKQLLGFARGGKYEPRPTDLNHIVGEGADLFGRTKKEIRIHKKLLHDLWPAEVDRGQIQQVLLNLYVNAWQAMPDGGEIYIHTNNQILDKDTAVSYQLPPGEYVSLTVSDTGIGIEPSLLPRIFDPFFTTKEKERGTGLGLAASYGIIQNHGGAIEVTSQAGSGSTFTIYLPASQHAIVDNRQIYRQPTQGSGTILLVDDEQMVVDVGIMMLKKLGYKVAAATSGNEAIKKYTTKKTDIVILDMIMPEMGGGEVFDRLKAVDPDVIVLLSSGYSLSGKTQEVFDRGCSGFIQKPFTMDMLSQKIQQAIRKAQS